MGYTIQWEEHNYSNPTDISILNGKTITKVDGLEKYSEEVLFFTDDGMVFKLYHDVDCCESVSLEDFECPISTLVGATIIKAEKVSSVNIQCDDSNTWTFYKVETTKGGLWMRWMGQSNGYYSEDVGILQGKLV